MISYFLKYLKKRRNDVKLSIRYKFALGFLAIFICSFVVLQHFIRVSIEQNVEKNITKELLSLQKESILYFSEKNSNISSEIFNKNVNIITEELCNKLENRVIAYSAKGEFLSDSINEEGNLYVPNEKKSSGKISVNNDDISLAVKNKSAYTINPVDEMYIVNYSFPVIINKERIGIIRISKDYTELYSDNYSILKNVNIAILTILLCSFIFSILFSERIVVPVLKLNKATNEIANGNYDFKIETKRKDEIGQLTHSFVNMKDKIQNQIIKISEERDKVVQLEQSRKEFFDNATHEMKTPLTVISGYAQILQKKGFDDKVFFERAVKNIKTESERMNEFVIQLLYMSKVGSEEMKREFTKVNISEVVSETSFDMGMKGEKFHIKIKVDMKEDIFVYGDRNALKQVFINILDNSIKYGDTNSYININYKQEVNYCTVSVKDQGRGIEKDKLERIFEPFYRGGIARYGEQGSTGLGLSIVKTIMENHNGFIQIESEAGKGAEVTIKIPLFDNNLAIFL